jgi:uncharacterized membrane protein HdeD (DUF308 family)
MQPVRSAMSQSLHAHWRILLAEGIVLLVLGLVAVALPPLATIAFESIVGWLLLVSGVVGLVSTFTMRRAPGFWWSLLSALAGITAGFVLLRWPLSGMFSLTVILTVFLLAEGIVSMMFAIDHRPHISPRWNLMFVSGLVDIVLAGIIFLGLPATAAWAIGLLLGINLVMGGLALIAMALHARMAAAPARDTHRN